MTVRARSQRTWLRLFHVVVGSLLATYVYLPPGQAPGLRWTLMVIGVPAVTVTGVWLWKQAAVRRLLSRRRSPAPVQGPRPAPAVTR